MENETRPVGRPLKFQSVEELDQAITAYFNSREPHIAKTKIKVTKADGTFYWQEDEILLPARPKTVSGLAMALGITRKNLINYKDKEEFRPSIEAALHECENYAEEMLYTPGAANGAKFVLTNNYNWEEKTKQDITSGNKPIPILGAIQNVSSDNGSDQDSTNN